MKPKYTPDQVMDACYDLIEPDLMQGVLSRGQFGGDVKMAREMVCGAVMTLANASAAETGRLMCRYHPSVLVMGKRFAVWPEVMRRTWLEVVEKHLETKPWI